LGNIPKKFLCRGPRAEVAPVCRPGTSLAIIDSDHSWWCRPDAVVVAVRTFLLKP
jgi:hypothetical protein